MSCAKGEEHVEVGSLTFSRGSGEENDREWGVNGVGGVNEKAGIDMCSLFPLLASQPARGPIDVILISPSV